MNVRGQYVMHKNIYVAILWLAVGWLACLALRVAGAETYYVATNGVDDRTGMGDWTNAVLTISNAVKKAATVNDLVLVSNGQYLLTAQITISSQITVQSWNNGIEDPTNTIVNGQGNVRCFNISHTGAVVEGVRIYNGNGSADGGGVYMTAGTLRNCIVVSNSVPTNNGGGVYFGSPSTGLVDNCLMAHNSATNGGGIYFAPYSGGTILVTNCVMRNNWAFKSGSASGGGGVLMSSSGGSAILANCSVYWNESACAGGITMIGPSIAKNCVISNNFTYLATSDGGGGGIKAYADSLAESPLITNCVIITNISNYDGGGIYMRYGKIANCRIIGNQMTNSVRYAGGVYVYLGGLILNSEIRDNFSKYYAGGVHLNSATTMRNCLIAGNVAANYGGGVFLDNTTASMLENCTIVSNSLITMASGGGISMGRNVTNMVANCIIYFNTVPSGTFSNYHHASSCFGSYSNCCLAPALTDVSTNYSTNNITFDPQFAGKDAADWRLKKESDCVNAGVNRNDWMANALDLDGHRRIDRYSGIVDMGCYEYLFSGTIYTIP